jgi:hypothetical protein
MKLRRVIVLVLGLTGASLAVGACRAPPSDYGTFQRTTLTSADLGSCPRGVNDKKLARCLADIEERRCRPPADTTAPPASCRAEELCSD